MKDAAQDNAGDNTGVTIDNEGDTIKVDGHPICTIAVYEVIRNHVVDEMQNALWRVMSTDIDSDMDDDDDDGVVAIKL